MLSRVVVYSYMYQLPGTIPVARSSRDLVTVVTVPVKNDFKRLVLCLNFSRLFRRMMFPHYYLVSTTYYQVVTGFGWVDLLATHRYHSCY